MNQPDLEHQSLLNTITQLLIPILTIAAQLAIALKFPQWGVLINLLAQPFWIYSAWKAYKKAGQIGLLITTIILTVVIVLGVVNYWLI